MKFATPLAALTTTFLLAATAGAQAPDALYVATYLDIQPGSVGVGATLAKEYARATGTDAGNLSARAFQELGRNNRFVVIEAWRDMPAFAAHDKSPHTLEFRAQLQQVQRSLPDQRLLRGLSIDPMPDATGSKAIYVVTHVDVPNALREQGEQLLRELCITGRMDIGHVQYDAYQQLEPRRNHFTVFAAWKSQSAFDAYGTTTQWRNYTDTVTPLLGALYDERLYRSIGR
jgi:quinol monooxygenase YgiN